MMLVEYRINEYGETVQCDPTIAITRQKLRKHNYQRSLAEIELIELQIQEANIKAKYERLKGEGANEKIRN